MTKESDQEFGLSVGLRTRYPSFYMDGSYLAAVDLKPQALGRRTS